MFDEDEVPRVYVPPGWPGSVRPPGAPGWVRTATAFLLDQCPPDYRAYPVLQRHPVVLARFARESIEGQLAATRRNLAGARPDLREFVDAGVADEVALALQREEARLVRASRATSLVEQTLRDVRFTPKL